MARFEQHGELDLRADDWLDRICEQLERGALLAHPTTSVYGIGGLGPDADLRVSRMKGRPGSVPIIRLVFDSDRLRHACSGIRWTDRADMLAEAFWPGPLTLVLDDESEHGMAVRAESHPVTRAVLERCDGALGSTSLNLTGMPAARTLDAARSTLAAMDEPGAPVLLLDAGDLPGPPPSTLLSLRDDPPRLLRAGAIAAARLEAVLGLELNT